MTPRTSAPRSSAFLAPTPYMPQLIQGSGLLPREFAERGVVEDHIRGHASLAGHLEPEGAQALEQIAVHTVP